MKIKETPKEQLFFWGLYISELDRLLIELETIYRNKSIKMYLRLIFYLLQFCYGYFVSVLQKMDASLRVSCHFRAYQTLLQSLLD